MKTNDTKHTQGIQHCFPPSILAHEVKLTDGHKFTLHVAPSETFGKALSRAGYGINQIESVSHRGPIWYECDYSIASR